MLGRNVISRARRNSPIAASVKTSALLPRSVGRVVPSVKSAEPDISKDSTQVSWAVPQKISVYAAMTRASHATRVPISDIGAYQARTRSRRA